MGGCSGKKETERLPSEILQGQLFLGNKQDALEVVNGRNLSSITHVLNVCDIMFYTPGLQSNGVLTEWVPISDDGLDDVFGELVGEEEYGKLQPRSDGVPGVRFPGTWWKCKDFLKEHLGVQGNRMLVHCAYGVNRSASIVVAWLMETRQWSLAEALKHVRDRRHIVHPAPGHMEQLKDFERHLRDGAPLGRAKAQAYLESQLLGAEGSASAKAAS